MHQTVRTMLLAGLVAGCHVSQQSTPDSMPTGDGSLQSGLHLSWSIRPQVPGGTTNNATIDDVGFKIPNLHVTGDAASVTAPGETDLYWNASKEPSPIDFATAPTGLYSKVSFRIDGQLLDNSYWVNGHVQLNGTTYPFKIYDRYYLDVSVQVDCNLSPGQVANLPIRAELDHAIDAIDWSLVDNDNGTLLLDTDDAWIPVFRQKLAESFVIGDQ